VLPSADGRVDVYPGGVRHSSSHWAGSAPRVSLRFNFDIRSRIECQIPLVMAWCTKQARPAAPPSPGTNWFIYSPLQFSAEYQLLHHRYSLTRSVIFLASPGVTEVAELTGRAQARSHFVQLLAKDDVDELDAEAGYQVLSHYHFF
jgi:hypothetical protein